MSFPPRPPPMGMPPMPQGMMTPGYGFTTMGMMPMTMGMMSSGPMIRGGMGMTAPSNSTTSTSTVKQSKKLVPQEIPKSDKKDDKPPVTTVFVGNISERAPDTMVRQMLMRCGNVLSWKRVQGASGKLQAFGFCEYEDPEATLRCIRLLNEWNIVDKKLVVKVDAKTKTLLDDYKAKKREREGKKNDDKGEIEDLDDFTQREDRVAKAGLDAIMREYSRELSKEPEHSNKSQKSEAHKEKKKEHQIKDFKEKDVIKDAGLDDMELEEEKKDLINREIKSFRDAHKDEDDKEKDRDRERERKRREEELRERERERERREREKELKRRERERTRSRSPADRSRSRERSKDRRDREKEDEEEIYERRKLERKLREKEAAYQERLKNWEARERKKTREYEKEKEKEEEKRAEELKEARRLKEFLEDYDDERDDPKFYKGSALQRRLKEREKEMEADARDRQREKEEIEEIRRRLLEEGHPDPEAEMAKIERERDEHLMPRLKIDSSLDSLPPARERERDREQNHEPHIEQEREPERIVTADQEQEQEKVKTKDRDSEIYNAPEPEPKLITKMQPTLRPVEEETPASSSRESSPDSDNEPSMTTPDDSSSQPFIGPVSREDQHVAKLGFGSLKLGSSDSPSDSMVVKRKRLTVGDVFNQDDEESAEVARKRKLVPLDYSEEEKAAVSKTPTTAEEKRKHIKNLIERIPTGKDELFAYTLDWSMVDQNLMDKRIKPWVNKKILDYIGEEEPTLTEFICQKVIAHSNPQSILNDVAMVLDEEAEVFVVKMWRLLIYETEAKKAGLVK